MNAAKKYADAVKANISLCAEIKDRISMWGADSIFDEKPKPRYELRSEPLTVTDREFRSVFKLNDNRRPIEYIDNDYEDNGETVIDHATGLMWQKSGSDEYMNHENAQQYVKELNEGFAGYYDWRLPTIDELTSLLEPKKQSQNLYIDIIFDNKQWWYWSSDARSSGGAFYVDFDDGEVGYWNGSCFVRAVRSFPDNDG